MSTRSTGPTKRRSNGTGTKPHWNAARQRWEVQVTLGDGKRRTVRGKTKHEAEKARDQLTRDLERGLPTPGERLTVADWLTAWLAWFKVKTLEPNPSRKRQSYRDYECLVRVHLVGNTGIGHESLAKLSVDRLERYLTAERAAGSSPRMVAKIRACLRAALSEAQRRGLVQQNVAKLVAVDNADESRVGEALRIEQIAPFLHAAAPHRSGPMFAVLVSTGLRLGEALALRWQDVDLPGRRLRVRHTLEKLPREPWRLVPPKSRPSRRTVPLVPQAIEALQQQKDRQEFDRRKAREAWVERDSLCLPTNSAT